MVWNTSKQRYSLEYFQTEDVRSGILPNGGTFWNTSKQRYSLEYF